MMLNKILTERHLLDSGLSREVIIEIRLIYYRTWNRFICVHYLYKCIFGKVRFHRIPIMYDIVSQPYQLYKRTPNKLIDRYFHA